MPGEVLADQRREASRVNGLLDEAVAPHGEARVALPLGGDRDDRNAAQRRLAPQPQRDLVAVEARDVEIDEDQIGPGRQSAANPLEAVDGVDDLEALGREQFAHEETVPGVVLDVQNTRHPTQAL